ncbi:MAG TPA: response regulator transcription factor [Micropepsaceae bacterium]|nr:response regulator transcription factor [Micropepsaceae bacterium]
MPEKKHQILLVDDHPLVRESLASLINQQPDLAVCGEAESVKQALDYLSKTSPDMAIIDLSLKESSGLDLIKTVKTAYPHIGMIVLSMHDERHYAERAIRAGARGYVMKRETTKKIIAAIHQVMAGKLGVSEEVAALFAEKFVDTRPRSGTPVEELSDRELEVFRLLGTGLDTRSVANRLEISIKTVQAYCARIKDKLNLANATELLREAIRWNESDAL